MSPRGKKSEVWEHFVKKDDKVMCNYCKRQLKFVGNTTNLREHLKRLHPTTLSDMNIVIPGPSTSSSTVTVPTGDNKITSADVNDNISSTEHSNKRPRQLRLFAAKEKVELSQSEVQELDNLIVEMVVKHFTPLSQVETDSFLKYSKKLNPLYNPPSRKTLTNKIIPQLYEKCCNELKRTLLTITHVAITTDIWTSLNTQSFLTVTAHFVEECKMQSTVLETVQIEDRHTAANLAIHLNRVFVKWQIEHKIVTIVTDNASNMKSCVNDFLKKHHHPCVAHTLNLCVIDSIQQNEEFTCLLSKCRSIVTHFKSSVLAAEKLKELQLQMNLPQLKVKQDIVTRWNSSLIMLKRLVELKVPLSATVTLLPKALEFFDADDWDVISDGVLLLQAFENLTIELSGEKYITISKVVPLIRGLQFSVKKKVCKTNIGKQLQIKLLDVVSRRLGSLESTKIVSKSAFLDPRFKKTGFGIETNAKTCEKQILSEVEGMLQNADIAEKQHLTTPTIVSSDPSNDCWEEFDCKAAEIKQSKLPKVTATLMLRQYCEHPLIPRQNNPLIFWDMNKSNWPELYELHKKYLCVPATSVPSERIFSKTGQVLTERRNRLSGKNLNYIIFLNNNMPV